jgi:ubiquinone/menaquinone biosynthesis C-methylase UbiE
MNEIKLLSVKYLQDKTKLREIDYWLKVMGRAQGWHYDMDIVWILSELEKAGIKKGATILDAGGGLGITQFILAARGYNVISLDFSKRKIPILAHGIFDIKIEDQEDLDYDHDYMGSVDYKESNNSLVNKSNSILKSLNNFLFNKTFVQKTSIINNFFDSRETLKLNNIEKEKNNSNYGSITFLRASFHDIPMSNGSVDALVSVSAIEHADKKLMLKNHNEMVRVVKKGGPLLISTSASNSKDDTFDEKTLGWCFSLNSLKKLQNNLNIDFEYNIVENEILSSKKWLKRLDRYYYSDPESIFYNKKMQSLPYAPVGIKIIKS